MPVRNSSLNAYRPENEHVPYVKIARAPTSSDIKNPQTNKYYTPPFQWVVGKNPSTGTEGDLYYLADITANVADWKLQATGSTPGGNLLTVTGDDSTAISPDGAGNIDLQGSTVANATNAKPLYVDGTGASSLVELELQVATERTGAPGDKNDAGVCSFDDTAFAVDADGYVTVAVTGGKIPLTFAGDSGTATPAASVITFAGGAGLTSSATGSTVTYNLDSLIVDNWVTVTDATQAAAVSTGYVGNRGTSITYTLPATFAVGDEIIITNIGAGLPVITANTGDTINFVDTATSSGGTMTGLDQYGTVTLRGVVANSVWSCVSATGNYTIA